VLLTFSGSAAGLCGRIMLLSKDCSVFVVSTVPLLISMVISFNCQPVLFTVCVCSTGCRQRRADFLSFLFICYFHYPSFPHSFTSGLKPVCFTDPSHVRLPSSLRTAF